MPASAGKVVIIDRAAASPRFIDVAEDTILAPVLGFDDVQVPGHLGLIGAVGIHQPELEIHVARSGCVRDPGSVG